MRVYLNGNQAPEIDETLAIRSKIPIATCFLGGRSDNDSNWEGRIDEVAVYDRILLPEELW